MNAPKTIGSQTSPTALARFVGGPPLAVALRLVFVSLVVGALLVWLDIRPYAIFASIQHMIDGLWAMGFDAVREIAQYIAVGAVLVVPVWLVMRVMNMRATR